MTIITTLVLVQVGASLLWSAAAAPSFMLRKGSRQAEPSTNFIGYYDASAQLELPPADIPHDEFLTHIVLTNALTVDGEGELHMREPSRPGEVSAETLISQLSSLPSKLVLSVRGHPDDVAFDEIAENDSLRAKFAASLASKVDALGADGVEVEWHSDDLAGGKPKTEAFDAEERRHFEFLCRDLGAALREDRGYGQKTLSVAVRPGRKEFENATFVRDNLDWLTLRAYSMRSVGDPHHSSARDMQTALQEWEAKGVPKRLLVLGTPLFGRPGASLRLSGGEKTEGSRQPWRELVNESQHSPFDGKQGDVFVEVGSGKAWWASGHSTTSEKVNYIIQNGYGGIAFRDLHHDATPPAQSLIRTASEVAKKAQFRGHRRHPKIAVAAQSPILFQKGVVQSKTVVADQDAADSSEEEFEL